MTPLSLAASVSERKSWADSDRNRKGAGLEGGKSHRVRSAAVVKITRKRTKEGKTNISTNWKKEWGSMGSSRAGTSLHYLEKRGKGKRGGVQEIDIGGGDREVMKGERSKERREARAGRGGLCDGEGVHKTPV